MAYRCIWVSSQRRLAHDLRFSCMGVTLLTALGEVGQATGFGHAPCVCITVADGEMPSIPTMSLKRMHTRPVGIPKTRRMKAHSQRYFVELRASTSKPRSTHLRPAMAALRRLVAQVAGVQQARRSVRLLQVFYGMAAVWL